MPKIELNGSLQVSQDVLQKVEDLISTKTAKDCCVLVMSNHRQQAFVIRSYLPTGKRQVAFCQHFVSDDIYVYWGNESDFSLDTNQPISEQVWDRAKVFTYAQVQDAARWIIHYLETGET